MKEPVYISFSEISTFLRCREQWDMSSANRQSIRHKATPKLYLSLGSAVHKALEANVKGENPLQAAEDYIEEDRNTRIAAYREEYGCKPWDSELKDFDETAELARGLVAQYFDHYGTDNPLADQGLDFLGIEIPFKIDVTHMVPGIGRKVYFCGTIDGIAADDDGNIFIVENKTFTQSPNPEIIQWHFQSTGYAVALEWLTGLPITGGLYNGLAKRLITEPRKLKNGSLSTDKRQATTLAKYVQAIRDNNEDPEDDRFADILSHLSNISLQGDTRFFYREKFFFKEEQLRSWEYDFERIINEMLVDPQIYRTIPYNGCGDCWFSDLCHSKHSGGDYEYTLEQRYRVGTYGTVEEVAGIEPTVVTSVDELKDYLNARG